MANIRYASAASDSGIRCEITGPARSRPAAASGSRAGSSNCTEHRPIANSSSFTCARSRSSGKLLLRLTPTTLTRPPSRADLIARSIVVSEPTASITASGPPGPVASRIAARRRAGSSARTGTAPSAAARSRRSAIGSTATTRAAPMSSAAWTAISPTGPSPMTATVSP
ncbi:hypothetical protein GCM10009613_01160 [Pseudonocardia kongjuensis]|uniref:Uncharacterized protein n=1 Tax=Pseudonocardia kongjuensis TaxID=102227 RepID=A0ABP4I7I6_9PSEU